MSVSTLLAPALLSALGLGLMVEAARRWETVPPLPPLPEPRATEAPPQPPEPPPSPGVERTELRCPPLPALRFSRGSAAVASADRARLESLATWLVEHPAVMVSIDGRADLVGGEESNLLLSHRRAQAAGEILLQAGLPRARVLVRALGAGGEATAPADAAYQRRADLSLSGGGLQCASTAEEER